MGDAWAWETTDHLLAGILDALRAGNWQRGHGKGSRPKPVKRPGDDKRFGTAQPVAVMRKILDNWGKA